MALKNYDDISKNLTVSQSIIVIMIALIEKLRFKQPEDILKFLICCDQLFNQLFNEQKTSKEIRRIKEEANEQSNI